MTFGLRLVLLMLISMAGLRADPGFLLGIDYSEWLPPQVTQIGMDGAGATYILSGSQIASSTPSASVTKLSADGTAAVWSEAFSFPVSTMAVGPDGSIYLAKANLTGQTATIDIVKLKADGSGTEWTQPDVFTVEVGYPNYLPALAVDASGRAYATSFTASAGGIVIRLTADGSVDYTSKVADMPTSIAVDALGNAFIAGGSPTGGVLNQLLPDGTAGFSVSLTSPPDAPFITLSTFLNGPLVAIDGHGNPAVYTGTAISRFDASGALLSSRIVATWPNQFPSFALDAAGNAYIIGSQFGRNYPVKNTLAPCDSDVVSVIAPDGTLLQTTYLPGGAHGVNPLLTVDPRGDVMVVDSPQGAFTPTRPGPLASNSPGTFLLRLAPDAKAVTYPLACYGNGASFASGPISPGEVLTLFGDGLGPQTGVAPQAPYPQQAASVQVTFDGNPASLLWVQNQQINLVTPWSLVPGKTTQVCVTNGAVKSNCLTLAVNDTAPGVFMVNGNVPIPGGSVDYAIALNQDGSVNSAANPAAPNSYVSIFATGLGAMSPTPVDGTLAGFPLASQLLQIGVDAVVVGGMFPSGPSPTIVQYAGTAPFRVFGISQVNFKLAGSGFSYQLNAGPAASPRFLIHVIGF